jgi:hypothetical protein
VAVRIADVNRFNRENKNQLLLMGAVSNLRAYPETIGGPEVSRVFRDFRKGTKLYKLEG